MKHIFRSSHFLIIIWNMITITSIFGTKIVGLLEVRNEAIMIAQCLKALSKYTDAIIVLDDCSTDNTIAIVESLIQECNIEKIIQKPGPWCYNEPGDRNTLLQAGRAIGGTHFIVIDADEMFTANCMHNNFLKNKIQALLPGESIHLCWIQLWRSVDQYRFDNSVWTWNYKPFIFADNGIASYKHDGFTHCNRIPTHHLNGKAHRISGYEHGLMHFQFVNLENLLIKQAWYRCLEHIRYINKSVYEINQTYKKSTDETGLKVKDCPKEWFVEYDFFNPSIFNKPESWRKKQILAWFDEYGKDHFKELDIWNIYWENTSPEPRMYISTACDHKPRYFSMLINFIGSLHHVNFDELEELAIFDLGLTQEQKNYLNTIQKVKIYNVEMTHPDLLKSFKTSKCGRQIPGWFAWKPVIIKQSLDIFPYVFYVDAGTTFLNPLNNLFKHIIQHGYFLTDCGHDIKWMTTRYVINKFDLESPKNKWILDKSTCGIAGGIQGLSQAVYDSYVMPMYELSKNLQCFVDDGTTPNGFGTGRHDQTIFSIIARFNKMDVLIQDNGDGRMIELTVDGKKIPMHITWNPIYVRKDTMFWSSRSHMPKFEFYKKCIRYKPTTSFNPPTYITGDTFRALANHIFDDRQKKFISNNVKNNDIIFVKGDMLDTFFKEHHPHIHAKYILVSHNSDIGITASYKPYLTDEKIIHWYGTHIEIPVCEKLTHIPLGITLPQFAHGDTAVFDRILSKLPIAKKNYPLVYVNFSISTNPKERQKVFDILNKKAFCHIEKNKSLEDYLDKMAQFKFAASPRGNGIDCHRTWEAMLVGTIPIIESSPLDPLYENLPVLIVKKWEDITEKFLNEQYSIITSKTYNLEKLFANYWLKLLKAKSS